MAFSTGKHVIMGRMRKDRIAEAFKNDISGMAGGAVVFDTKRSLTVVASATGGTRFHPPHADLVAVGFCSESIGVAFVTAEHLSMNGMAEGNRTDTPGPNGHLTCIAVTGGTITADAESGTAVVTGAARVTGLHLLHADLVAVGFCFERFRVTLAATEHFRMQGMAEGDGADVLCLNGHINGSVVAGDAVAAHAESGITVVAGATRFTILHLLHTNPVAVGLGPENIGVAFTTLKHVGVEIVTEDDRPDTAPDGNVLSVINPPDMATCAIFTDTKRGLPIMAGTTGRTGLHPLHTNLVAVGLGPEYIRMAFVAAKHLGMNRMTEGNAADIPGLNVHIYSIAVAGGAVVAHTKSGIAIVTGAARFTGLHLLHTNLGAVGLGLERVRVAFVTAEHLRMNIVAENDITDRTLNGDIGCALVAAAAIAFDAEGRITIMAGATGLAGLHFGHTNLVAVSFRFECVGVAFTATEHPGMDIMAENDVTNDTLDGDIFGVGGLSGMTTCAIFSDAERSVTIMAGTTGVALLHFPHANLVAVGTRLE